MAPVALPETIPPVLMVELFSLEEPIQPSHGKRPLIENNELDERYIYARLKEKEELELVFRRSRHDEKMRQVQETKMDRGTGPSGQSTIAE